MTSYSHRWTFAVPAALAADANQLMLCLGESEADARTFHSASWENSTGDKFAVASLPTHGDFQARVQAALVAPDFAPDADLEAAGRAQSALLICDPDNPPQATTASIYMIEHANAVEALDLLGVQPVQLELDL